jgi:4-amino-4-deoxy-L-arabinose transferase-like glycosyltransferase
MTSFVFRRKYVRRLGYAVVLVAGVAAVAVRFWWARAVTPQPISDAAWYWNEAVSLAAGHGYAGDGFPTAYRPVGYSAALAPFVWYFGDDAGIARSFNASISALTLCSLFLVTHRLTGSLIAGLFALLIFGAYPADIGFTSLVLCEPLFNALCLAAIAVFVTGRRFARSAALVGVLIALATLTRPQAIFLLPILGAALLLSGRWRRSAGRYALTMCTALALTMAPWWIRNARAFHAFVPVSTNGGVNLLMGNNAEATGCYGFSTELREHLAARFPESREHPIELAYDRYAAHLAVEFIRHEPRSVLALWPKKIECLLYHEGAFGHFSRKIPREQRALLNELQAHCQLYYRAMLWLAGVGFFVALAELIVSRRARRTLLWLPGAVIVSFVVVALITFGDPRFHHPIMSWVAMYAGYCLNLPLRALRAALRWTTQALRDHAYRAHG